MNDRYLILVVVAVIGVFVYLRLRGSISAKQAREFLQAGAVVIDVRTEGEYASGALPGARNLPLDQLGDRIRQEVPDRESVVLCHCLSGMRSAQATGLLRKMGYRHAFNLGGYRRAGAILAKN